MPTRKEITIDKVRINTSPTFDVSPEMEHFFAELTKFIEEETNQDIYAIYVNDDRENPIEIHDMKISFRKRRNP